MSVQEWTCPHGHHWRQTATRRGTKSIEPICPHCGAAATVVTAQTYAETSLASVAGNEQTLGATLAPGGATPATSAAVDDTLAIPGNSIGADRSFVADSESLDPGSSAQSSIESEQTLAKPGESAPGAPVSTPSANDVTENLSVGLRNLSDEATIAGSSGSSNGPPARDQPSIVSGYEILGTLGRGAMGVVYKAKQRGLNRLTALKMILAGAHASELDFIRFRTEAEAVAKLQHPNIVQIYEVGERDGHPFFSLEYVEGGTLQGKLDGKPTSSRFAAQTVEALARAMHFAHERGIIHRDLKPANVLLAADGTPKIADFGLAKSAGDDSHQTGSGSILGTPSYMAPEQAEGRIRELGPAVDIYALGAILYTTLTGRPPFVGESVLETLRQVRETEPVAPSRLQPKVPRDLDTICLKCLQKDPAKRYATSEALADDLGRFLKNEPILARPVGLIERTIKWVRRHPSVAALLCLLAIVLAGGFFGMFTLWIRAEVHQREAEKERSVAEKERGVAQKERQIAQDASAAATSARKEVEKSFQVSLRTLYDANMNLAQEALEEAKIGRLKELLEGYDPTRSALIGFEWNYLWRLYKSDRLALKSHVQLIRAVAFRPPAVKQVASASGDGTIVLWDPDAATPKHRILRGHKGAVQNVAFRSDGKVLASAGEDGLILLWDLESEAPPRQLKGHLRGVTAVTFSPDGKRLASGSNDRTIKIWDLDSGSEMATLRGHLYGITDLAFSPDGKRLASASLDRTARVWDVAEAKELFYPLEHKHWVLAVAFDARGKYLVSASWDRKVKGWDAATGQELFTLESQGSPVRQLAFSPDGLRLAASCLDQSGLVWDLSNKKLLFPLEAKPGLIRSAVFSADGQLIASVNFNLLTKDMHTLRSPSSVLAVTFAGDDQTVIGGGDDGVLRKWNLNKPDEIEQMTGHTGPVRALAYGPQDRMLVSASEDTTLGLWRDGNNQPTFLKGHDRWVQTVAFSPKGRYFASGGGDGLLKLWDVEKLDSPRELKGHAGGVNCAVFSPDGTALASGGADQCVRIHVLASAKETILPGKGIVQAIAWSPLGRLLASADADRVIHLWDVDAGTEKFVLKGHTDTITALSFTRDGHRLISGSADHTVKIWDVGTGQETLTLKGHSQGVTDLRFSMDGDRLVSSSWDGTILVWDASAP